VLWGGALISTALAYRAHEDIRCLSSASLSEMLSLPVQNNADASTSEKIFIWLFMLLLFVRSKVFACFLHLFCVSLVLIKVSLLRCSLQNIAALLIKVLKLNFISW
jgi:hypothetical protein